MVEPRARQPIHGRGTWTARAAEVVSDLGRRHKPDYWLVTFCVVLLAIGLMVVYAISPALSAASGSSDTNYYVTKQLVAIAISAVAFVVTSQIPLQRWRQVYKPLLIIAALATLVALVTPANPLYPAHRWVRLGSLSFQSVEIVKFALLIAVAGFLTQRIRQGTIGSFQQTLKPLLLGLLVVGIAIAGPEKVHAQSDLGSMGVIVAMLGVMCYVAGIPRKQLLMIVGTIAIGVILVILPSGYRRDRLAAYLHPATANCAQQVTGYQACQALVAVGSGGMIGLGLGHSVQANGYLPEAANDSIFAIYAEVFGFIGAIVLLGIFLGFFNRLKRIAERAPDDFSRLLVAGVLTWLSVQALINIGAMIGVLPLKGITLPFISYGGTSVVFVAAAVGLVFQISRYTSFIAAYQDERSSHDNSRDRRRVRGAYHPNSGSR